MNSAGRQSRSVTYYTQWKLMQTDGNPFDVKGGGRRDEKKTLSTLLDPYHVHISQNDGNGVCQRIHRSIPSFKCHAR